MCLLDCQAHNQNTHQIFQSGTTFQRLRCIKESIIQGSTWVCAKLTIFYHNVLFFRSMYGNFDFDFFCKLAKKNFKTMNFSCNLSGQICITSPKSLDQSAPLLGPAVAASLLPPCTYLTLPFTCDVAHEAFKPLSLFGNFLHDSL